MKLVPTYAYLDKYGWVRQWSHEPRPLVGADGAPGPFLATPVDGLTLDVLPEGFEVKPFLRKVEGVYVDMAALAGPRPSDSAELVQVADTLQWQENVPLAQIVTQARASIDRKAELARMAVLVEPTKEAEYKRAEAVARPYRDGGYADPVPEAVASWAWAKRYRNGGTPWTGKQAADDILQQADTYYALLDGIRRLRLDAMEHCLAIADDPEGTHAQVDAVEAQFDAALMSLMQRTG
jgi:hypothetical protein